MYVSSACSRTVYCPTRLAACVAVAVVAAAGRFLFLASDYAVRTGYMCGACGSDQLAVLENVFARGLFAP